MAKRVKLTFPNGWIVECPLSDVKAIYDQFAGSKVLLPRLEKHRLLKRRKRKPKIFNSNPKSPAEAKKMDLASLRKSKSVRTISGGAIESNRRRH